jgi:hypothetical protein
VLTGFLPPEDGTGRGMGYVAYTVAPKAGLASGTVIRNVATIGFDANPPIATNQVDDEDASKGTDPNKEAKVTIDSAAPSSQMKALATRSGPFISLSWSGADDANGSGLAGYTVMLRMMGGIVSTPFLAIRCGLR